MQDIVMLMLEICFIEYIEKCVCPPMVCGTLSGEGLGESRSRLERRSSPLVRPPSGLPLSYRRRSHIAESHIIPIQRKAPLPRSLAGFRQEPNSHRRGGTGAA